MSEQLDMLAIGDVTTDAFIRLKEASVTCDIDRKNCRLCVTFGDKIPYEFVEVVRAVGNSANAAVACARLGLKAGFLTNIGDDQNGRECLEQLQREKIDTSHVTTHQKMETNYHYVLWYEEERTILVKHQAYPYKLPVIDSVPRWIYLSSLGGNSENYHYEIIEYLDKHPEVKLAFQPGTFQMSLGYEKLAKLYKRSDIFFCNVEEAKRILDIDDPVEILLKEMRAAGPRNVVITDGPKGAYAYDGKKMYFMPIYPDKKPPYERTGAGDAFASTVTAALMYGKGLEEALLWGPINSMSVVQQIGAQRGLLTRVELEVLLSESPADYKSKVL